MQVLEPVARLDPELSRCVVSVGHGEKAILHPLLRQESLLLTAEEISRINRDFYRQKAKASNALRDRRYVDYVFCYQPRYQFDAFLRVVDRYMPTETKQALIRETFTQAPSYWANLTSWRRVLRPYEDRDWWETLDHVGEAIELWRGGRREGLTWTSRRDRAIVYAHAHHRSKTKILYSATLPKTYLIASWVPDEYVWLPPPTSSSRIGVTLTRHPCP